MAGLHAPAERLKKLQENEEARNNMCVVCRPEQRAVLVAEIESLLKLTKERYSETVFEYPGDAVIYNKVAWFLAKGHSVADALHNTDTAVITDILRQDIAKRTGK